MLNRIINSTKWKSGEKRQTVILVDETFGELLKWENIKSAHNDIILDFFASSVDDMSVFKTIQPERILFLVADALNKQSIIRFKSVIVASSSPECIIYTSSSPESISHSSRFESKEPYVFLQDFLQPSSVGVYYFPMHSIDLMHIDPDRLDVRF
jgi:hypothetical protein